MPSLQEMHPALPFLVKLTVWCAIPFALKPLLSRVSAARRHLILTLFLAGSLALPALWVLGPSWTAPPPLQFFDSPQEPAVAFPERASEALAPVPGGSTGALGPSSSPLVGTPRSEPFETPGLQRGFAMGSSSEASEALNAASAVPVPVERLQPDSKTARGADSRLAAFIGPAVFFSWVLGIALMAIWVGSSIRRVRSIVRKGRGVTDAKAQKILAAAAGRLEVEARPRLLETAATAVPFAWGGGAGTIVLPESWRRWSPQRLDVVLTHELAHLHRRDPLALAIGRLATALWWFHPLVHGLDAWARKDCEQATDDAVLLSGSRPSDYANHLIAIGRSLPRPLPAGVSLMMSTRSNLKSRLLAILRPDQPRQGWTRRGVWGASFLILVSAIALAGLRLTPSLEAQEAPEKDPNTAWEKDSRKDLGEDHDPQHGHGHSYAYSTSKGESSTWDVAYEAHNHGRYEEAIAGFEKAASEGIRPATSTYNAACGYALSGRPEEALASLRKAMDLGLDSPELLAEDSDLDSLRGDSRFQALVDKAFAEAGQTRDPVHHYRYRTSQETLEWLQEKDSRDPDAWAKVGRTLLSTRQLDDAVLALGNAVRFDPEPGGNSHYNLACAHALAGEKAQALGALEDAVHAGYSDPDHMKMDPDLISLRDEARFEELRELARDLDLNRFRKAFWQEREERSLTSKVIHWVSKGEHTEYSPEVWAPAIEFYEGFTRKNPEIAIGWFNLGYALHYSERFEEAGAAFRQARDLGFRRGTSTYNIACGLSMRGLVDEGIAALEEALELGFDSSFKHDSDLDNLRSEERFRALALEQELRQKHG